MLSRSPKLLACALALAWLAPAAPATPQFEPLAEFSGGQINPTAALVRHPDGFFYGTTTYGGTADLGTVFRVDANGSVTTLVDFTGPGGARPGSRPFSELVVHPDGSLYGVAPSGGSSDAGVVYRVTTAGSFRLVAEFPGGSGGRAPVGALVLHPDGNFYGTTSFGGALDHGTIFRLSPAGALTTLADFTGTSGTNRGHYPRTALTLASDGSFYGTTQFGGAGNLGTIFRATTAGALTTLVDFTSNGATNAGAQPSGAVTVHSDGQLYGTTQYGGANNAGTVYRLTPEGVLTTLWSFAVNEDPSGLGSYPTCTLLSHSNGSLYGTTQLGGFTFGGGSGTVFAVAPGGTLSRLGRFPGNGSGERPYAGVVLGADEQLYGTTFQGGTANYGTVFRVPLTGGNIALLSQFYGSSSQGANPGAMVSFQGRVYGSTNIGGIANLGVIYRLEADGSLVPVVEFTGIAGARPGGGPGQLVVHSDGNLYGTTQTGGAGNFGTIFRLTPRGNFSVVVEFTKNGASNRGSSPGGLISHPDGHLYGVTAAGGAADRGTVFRLTNAGTLQTLFEFSGSTSPAATLVAHPSGDFYGATPLGGAANAGTIFRLSQAGVLTTVLEFTGSGGAFKGRQISSLLLHTDGHFYGVTQFGGSANQGTVFQWKSDGTFTTLLDFSGLGGPLPGSRPAGRLLAPGDGFLYGVTFTGGSGDYGTVFRLTPAGAFTSLAQLTFRSAPAPGAGPAAGLAYHTDGNLYGTALYGGQAYNGAAFRLRLGPKPTTLAADAIQPGSAVLRGAVNPNGSLTNAVFEYGTDPAALNQSTLSQALGGGTADLAVSAPLTGLQPSTTYYFRVRGDNAEQLQPQRGEIRSFTTLSPGTNLVSLALEPGVGTRMRWLAAPGQSYTIQSADTLAGPWTSFPATVQADGSGQLEFVDPTTPVPARRFYRNVSVP